ncbi:MAG: hypothetical protein P4L45_16265 [Ignavibacteriaceae bacterium]|nr:hypothetical protein [Ignavibacteriaceae bacterium]
MKNEYKANPAEFVNEVEKFSKSKLKRKAELIRIYEEAVNNNNEKLFEDLVFTAKYVQGLLRVVKSGSANSEINNLDQIKKDFTDNLNKVVLEIKKIISGADEDMKTHFEQTYFELSQQGFINISELLSDLEWTKIYLNDRKRNPE